MNTRGWRWCRAYLDDGAGERVGDDVEQVGGVVPPLDVEGVDHELGELVEHAGGHLQRQQHQHRQPVEEVVDRGSRERPAGQTPSQPRGRQGGALPRPAAPYTTLQHPTAPP